MLYSAMTDKKEENIVHSFIGKCIETLYIAKDCETYRNV